MARRTEDSHNIRERDNGFIRAGAKARPVPRVLFRPEEMDSASRIIPVFGPLPQRDTHIAPDFRRASTLDNPVTYRYAQRFAAMKTWGIHLNRLTREDPADRQGFETSLRKPFLLPVNGYAIGRGQGVERRERRNQIGIGVEPDWQLCVVHEVVEELFAFVGRYGKSLGDIGVVRGTALFDKSLHNEMVEQVKLPRIGHISSFLRPGPWREHTSLLPRIGC